MKLCKCGCKKTLRKDNKTGYQKGHKPCPVCGTLVTGSSIECCSKSCSAQLHWKRNPEMKEARSFNPTRFASREKNREILGLKTCQMLAKVEHRGTKMR